MEEHFGLIWTEENLFSYELLCLYLLYFPNCTHFQTAKYTIYLTSYHFAVCFYAVSTVLYVYAYTVLYEEHS